LGLLAPLAAAAALVLGAPAGFVAGHQGADGCFGDPGLSAWSALGLRAAGAPTGAAQACLAAHEGELTSPTDLELVLLAEAALGDPSASLVARVRALERPNGSIGGELNSTFWGVLALRQAGLPVRPETTAYLVRAQSRAGGWSWTSRGSPDSNDTAAAVQALVAAGGGGVAVRRAVAFLRRFQASDGGFELTRGRGSDVPSTAWAIQAFLAAGVQPPTGAFRYLTRMQRPDGSLRYTARSGATPLWVTAQALAALARRPFPLR
jgi:hypothetical protein